MKKYFKLTSYEINDFLIRLNNRVIANNKVAASDDLSKESASFSDIISWLRFELIETDMKFKFDEPNRHITIYNGNKKTIAAIQEVEVLSVKQNLKVA